MNADWYQEFESMRANIFDGTPEAAARARAFYLGIVGHEALVRLTVSLRLRLTDGGQDWDIETADASRLSDFLDCFEGRALDDDERYALLQLIVASLDEYLTQHDDGHELTARVRRHLDASFRVHSAIVEYWACLNEPERERFAVTRMMRELWRAPR